MSSIYDQQSNPPPKPSGSPFDQPGYGMPVGQQPIPPEQKKRSGCTCVGCLLGCMGVVLVLSVVAGIGTWWFVKKIPDFAHNVIEKAVSESDLTADDKKTVMTQVDRLIDGYKQGKVDMQKMGEFAENFAKSPLMDLMIAYAAKVKYIDPSNLSDEEKAEAERILQRLARGVVEQEIPDEDLDVALNHISNEVGNGGRQFRDNVSDAELRAFISECKRLVDEHEIPEGEYKVDIGAELKKLVDEALGEAPPAEDPPAQAPPAEKAEAAEKTPEAPPTPAAPDTKDATKDGTDAPPAEKPEQPAPEPEKKP